MLLLCIQSNFRQIIHIIVCAAFGTWTFAQHIIVHLFGNCWNIPGAFVIAPICIYLLVCYSTIHSIIPFIRSILLWLQTRSGLITWNDKSEIFLKKRTRNRRCCFVFARQGSNIFSWLLTPHPRSVQISIGSQFAMFQMYVKCKIRMCLCVRCTRRTINTQTHNQFKYINAHPLAIAQFGCYVRFHPSVVLRYFCVRCLLVSLCVVHLELLWSWQFSLYALHNNHLKCA